MSIYLGYDEITKQYLRSLGGGGEGSGTSGGGGLSASGFTMTGDIDMGGNEITGLGDPTTDSSATSKKYVSDEIAKVPTTGGLDQAAADNRYLKKTDASGTYETKSDASNAYLSKTDARNDYLSKTDAFSTYETKSDATNTFLSKVSAAATYLKNSVFNSTIGTYMRSSDINTNFLKKTDAASAYAPADTSYTKVESDNKYSLKGSGGGGGGLSASGFAMTGDIDMGDNKILKLADPVTSKSATNKEYVDNNFLSKHGGLILGNIAMSGQSITNLNPTPQSSDDAVTKGYVDNQIKLSGGLSITGITMQGDIDMNAHNVVGLSDPTNDDMAASKGYVDGNFLDIAGGTMVGGVDMGGYEITNMLRIPTTDLSAVTKKWVSDEFPTKQEVLGGFTLTGALDLSGNEVYGLPDVPTTDNSATSKKYVDSKFVSGGGLSASGFTMKGDINMGGYEVIGVTGVPSFNNSLANKKYVDDEVSAVRGGMTQASADARYVRKTKLTLVNWFSTFDDVNFVAYNWSPNVRMEDLNSGSNIVVKSAVFDTTMSSAQLSKHNLIIGAHYISGNTAEKELVTIDLSGKMLLHMYDGINGNVYAVHIHEEVWVGSDTSATDAELWQLGIKFKTHATHVLLSTKAYVSFALNEAGQYG